jgi:hypothetical protein
MKEEKTKKMVKEDDFGIDDSEGLERMSLRKPMFSILELLIITACFIIIIVAASVTFNERTIENNRLAQSTLTQYQLDGAFTFNSYYNTHLQYANSDLNELDLQNDWSNRFYGILQFYENDNINTDVNLYLTCVDDFNTKWHDMNEFTRRDLYNQCLSYREHLNEEIYIEMKDRYVGVSPFLYPEIYTQVRINKKESD